MSFVNELDDLCDFTKISQRWKQNKQEPNNKIASPAKTEANADCSSIASQKSNPWNKENSLQNVNTEEFKKTTLPTKVRSHAPQVIDEDTEQFKIRLEHLLNVFKSEATSEFMQMKRSMLEDQKMTIKQDTEKYLLMYENKNAELQQTKEALAEQMKTTNILAERNEKLAAFAGKLKQQARNRRTMHTIMKALRQNQSYQRKKKLSIAKAKLHYQRQLVKQVYRLWYKIFNLSIRESVVEKMKLQQQSDLDLLVGKFRKEQQLLEQKLLEANTQLEESNRIKISMQENLKRAFMRGVCALNFEAMNVLNGNASQIEFDALANNLLINPVASGGNQLNETLSLNESKEAWHHREPLPQSNVVFHQANRIETNDHKWKDAPLVGRPISEISENQSINMSISKLIQQDESQFERDPPQEEGRIIKVNIEQPQSMKRTPVQKTVQQAPANKTASSKCPQTSVSKKK